jgi:hypothetical protein
MTAAASPPLGSRMELPMPMESGLQAELHTKPASPGNIDSLMDQ